MNELTLVPEFKQVCVCFYKMQALSSSFWNHISISFLKKKENVFQDAF